MKELDKRIQLLTKQLLDLAEENNAFIHIMTVGYEQTIENRKFEPYASYSYHTNDKSIKQDTKYINNLRKVI